MRRRSLKMAFVQHPMILVIHEDRGEPMVGEREGPVGAPDLETYAGRVRRNLEALQQFPDLFINYELSGVELEMLAEVAPDAVEGLREMATQGRVAFVGGDYSQPHGHLYSGELNYRQFEVGLRVVADLTGYRVTCCFHQETFVHDQMPQLLRGLGFESTVSPHFPHTIIPLSLPGPRLTAEYDWLPGHPIVPDMTGGYRLIAADSTPSWQGLDGTEIPLVIPGVFHPDAYHRDLYRLGELCLITPDMCEASESLVEVIRSVGDFVSLEEQAQEEIDRHPATWKARLVSFWSYSEGEWAEAMCRGARSLESQLVAEETVSALHASSPRPELDADWRTLLASMHHDVHCLHITDLKRTYLERMDFVSERSREHVASIVDGAATPGPGDEALHVINTLPLPRREVVTVRGVAEAAVCAVGFDGAPVPSQCIRSQDHPGQYDLYFLAEVPACGSVSYGLTTEGAMALEGFAKAEVCCQARDARYSVLADGTVGEAVLADGANVLCGPGHDLHYLDADGQVVGGPGRSGRLLHYRGEVGDVVRVSAPVGDVPTSIEYLASPAMSHLAFTTRFKFDGHQIGVIWEESTKLNSYWPTNGGVIRHDVPFGVVDGSLGLPLYAPSWLSVSGTQGGVALINTGTPKHYVEDGVIGNVLAWGGREIVFRMQGQWSLEPPAPSPHDLSLSGVHHLRAAVQAVPADHSEVALARTAQRVNTPLLVFGASPGAALPPPRWSLDLSRTSLMSSALFLREDRPVCRFWESGGTSQTAEELREALGMKADVTDLAGESLEVIDPYRIGYLLLPPI
ncbi:MAG: hypothetical protein GTN78_03955 [Gemmatimonadales bacterium]|nr:hypothetical protein [Gemmatimonadales bacterium]